ncbi:three component ABC system middle component [Delftia sp. WSY_22]|uniref:three component ABC system middle component n=1 Tax=Delftia sp. WSY_22 TaxID=3367213 RepID=UPI00370C07E5
MIAARDIFAETNPAFCGAVLAQFCSAYQAARHGACPAAALVYLVVPLVISEDLATTFDGCNRETGFTLWMSRNPNVSVDLAKKVNSTLQITTTAIRFGCIAGIFKLTTNGDVESFRKTLPAAVTTGVAGAALKRARLLGIWMAGMGSPRSVLEALGVSV